MTNNFWQVVIHIPLGAAIDFLLEIGLCLIFSRYYNDYELNCFIMFSAIPRVCRRCHLNILVQIISLIQYWQI